MDFDTVVLAAATADLTDEPAARSLADAMEFRMDLASAPSDVLADYDGALPLIVTNRSREEGGEAPAAGRLRALREALDHPSVAAVDVELAAIEAGEADALLTAADRAGVTVIASTHDFEGMPDPDRLDDILRRVSAAGDVGKLAATAGDPGDALDLLAATWRATRAARRVATMAMGTPGQHTRAVAPCYGSRIAYAPVDPDRATAPGQYDLATLRELLDRLG